MAMDKKQIKNYLKNRVGIFPEDIITKRPEGMSFEDYKKERARVNACLKDYLSRGRMEYVVSKGMYSVDPKTGKVFMYGINTERGVDPAKRTLGIPYVSPEKRERRLKEKQEREFKSKQGIYS